MLLKANSMMFLTAGVSPRADRGMSKDVTAMYVGRSRVKSVSLRQNPDTKDMLYGPSELQHQRVPSTCPLHADKHNTTGVLISCMQTIPDNDNILSSLFVNKYEC